MAKKKEEDKFIFMTTQMINTQDRLIKKAFEMRNWGRLSELESYKGGLEQALANYRISNQVQ